MKLRPALIAVSLGTNAVLAGVIFFHPVLAPPGIGDFLARHFHDTDGAPTTPNRSATASDTPSPTQPLWTALQTADLSSLVSRLRAAGFPADVIREIIRAQVNARSRSRLATLMAPDPKIPFWKTPPGVGNDPKRLDEIARLERERSQLLRELLVGDFFADGDLTAAQRRQFGNLSRSKIDALQRIEDDYAEMLSRLQATVNGISLPEDRATFALINREKLADLATILTPEELADYTVRSSPTTAMLRSTLGLFEPSEAEFSTIFQQQRILNEKYQAGWAESRFASAEERAQSQILRQQTQEQLKASFGEARYAEYSRATRSIRAPRTATSNSSAASCNPTASRTQPPCRPSISATKWLRNRIVFSMTARWTLSKGGPRSAHLPKTPGLGCSPLSDRPPAPPM